MNRILSSLRYAVFAIFMCLLVLSTGASYAHGQSSEPPPSNPSYSSAVSETDYCNLWEADYANSVEETVCFTTDYTYSTEIDIQAEVDQDLTWYEDYPDWPELGEDPNVAGLGAEAVAYDYSTSTEVQDTGMTQGSLSGGDPPTVTTPWNYDSTYMFTPSIFDTYQVEGYYSECIDPTGTGSSSCNWNGTNDSGIAVFVYFTGE